MQKLRRFATKIHRVRGIEEMLEPVRNREHGNSQFLYTDRSMVPFKIDFQLTLKGVKGLKDLKLSY